MIELVAINKIQYSKIIYTNGTRKLFQNTFHHKQCILSNQLFNHFCHISLEILAHPLSQAFRRSPSQKNHLPFVSGEKNWTIRSELKYLHYCSAQIVGTDFYTVSYCTVMIKVQFGHRFLRDLMTLDGHFSEYQLVVTLSSIKK